MPATGCFTDAQLAFVPARRADGLPGCARPLPPTVAKLRCQLPQQPLEPAAVVAAAAGEAVESAGAGAGAAPDAMLHQPRSRTHWPRRLPAALAPQPLQHGVAAGSGGSGPCVGRCRGRTRRCGQGRASRRSAATKSAAATRALPTVCSSAPPSTPLPQVALHVAAAQPRAAVSCDEGRRRGLAHGRGWGLGLQR